VRRWILGRYGLRWSPGHMISWTLIYMLNMAHMSWTWSVTGSHAALHTFALCACVFWYFRMVDGEN